jgi:cysteine desulfurase
MTTSIYLDHAAATPLDKRVFAVMEPYFTEQFYNPSSPYTAGRSARNALEEARHRLAIAIGGQKDEIILTAGATESVNIALSVVNDDEHLVVGATEHAAVKAVADELDAAVIPVDKHGLLLIERLGTLIRDNTTLVSIAYADSELGTVQSLRKAADIVADIRDKRSRSGNPKPLYLHTDASQAAMLCDLNVARLGVDLMTVSAAKCYGPKQVALLWIRAGIKLKPVIKGGGQERGLRSGTENVAGAVGFAEALTRAQSKRHQEATRLKEIKQKLTIGLTDGIADVVINGHAKRSLPSHLHISVPNLDAERAVFGLDQEGVMVATGAACAANKNTRSSVLTSVGMSDELADGSLRISLGHLNDVAQVEQIVEIMVRVIERERLL